MQKVKVTDEAYQTVKRAASWLDPGEELGEETPDGMWLVEFSESTLLKLQHPKLIGETISERLVSLFSLHPAVN